MDEKPITDLSHLTNEEIDRFVKEQLYHPPTFLSESDALKQEAHWVKPAPHNGYGVSVAMLLWSVCLFAFAIFSPFPVWVHGCAEVLGLLALLIGILGTCIEVFKGKA